MQEMNKGLKSRVRRGYQYVGNLLRGVICCLLFVCVVVISLYSGGHCTETIW